MFKFPLSFAYSACAPIAVFCSPFEPIAHSKALEPIAVLREPVELLQSEPAPNDVLLLPVVLKKAEFDPTDVLFCESKLL